MLNFCIGSVSSIGGLIAATLFAVTISDDKILGKSILTTKTFRTPSPLNLLNPLAFFLCKEGWICSILGLFKGQKGRIY